MKKPLGVGSSSSPSIVDSVLEFMCMTLSSLPLDFSSMRALASLSESWSSGERSCSSMTSMEDVAEERAAVADMIYFVFPQCDCTKTIDDESNYCAPFHC